MAKVDWQNRIIGHGEAAPEDLMPNPLNWRAHPSFQRAALDGVLREVGWVTEVIVNKRTGNLIDGHLRVDMARGKGVKVPYTEVDVTEEEERIILATLDPIAALATADQDVLAALIAQVDTQDEDVRALLERLVTEGSGLPDTSLVEGGDFEGEALGFGVEVVVQSPDDRDKASEALTKAGFTPKVRTIRHFDDLTN